MVWRGVGVGRAREDCGFGSVNEGGGGGGWQWVLEGCQALARVVDRCI